ncbi:hypothetical protein ANANG_G00177500 [Anguilla anguilla]|uniref:Uncharacterized protein n=1 Tax=Anguilla anguilla TaxID=7936 RepID=A0A9D3MB79_ANGAN|nr:hypothetical protein ANANG_G00177500 [Anguilla anguilla]
MLCFRRRGAAARTWKREWVDDACEWWDGSRQNRKARKQLAVSKKALTHLQGLLIASRRLPRSTCFLGHPALQPLSVMRIKVAEA